METAADRRPQLPALSYLDVDKATASEDNSHQTRKVDSTPTKADSPTSAPSTQFPSGPPPPYNRGHVGWNGERGEAPPSSRESRLPGPEEMENMKQALRQSLPSITEALNMEAQKSYGTSPPISGHISTQSSQLPRPRSVAAHSPSPTRRGFGVESSHPPPSFASNSGRHSSSSYSSPTYPSQEARISGFTPSHDGRSSISSQTSQPPPSNHQPAPYTSAPSISQYEHPPPAQAIRSMAPPDVPYGYSAHSRYSQPVSSAGGPVYQPSAQYSAPPTPSTSTWKSEGTSRYESDERPVTAYGDSVKRHLEMYDLEAALTEISSSSRIMLDFSRRYGEHMHQTARAGPSLSTLPSLVEIDDMIHKSRVQLDSLAKIRDVIVTQQAAYEQQLADQRAHPKAYAEAPPVQPNVDHSLDGDGGGGFAGGDSKKRRRAAPPGRCHSCNRAETPEWRRGPDGARTLCNACGLHYAKLTRKQASANKAASAGSSNLRPKE